MSSCLPSGWTQRESKSRAGKLYYINNYTGETTWDRPTEDAVPMSEQVQVLHLLKKHSGSRRPASWRCPNITQSKEEAIAQISAFRTQLLEVKEARGGSAMLEKFKEIAYRESDCGSHERGGDLGLFGKGQMQLPFEQASFALEVGELSDLVDTDSGIHIILRVQ